MTTRWSISALCLITAFVPATALAVASAELYGTQPYFYGRFEARIRLAAGDGVVSSFFLWKEGSSTPGSFWNELDFEKVAADCHMTTNALYDNPGTNHSQTNVISGDLCGAYHDYAFEWTPTYIAWIVDGREIRRDTGANVTAYSQNATAGMTFHFNIWPGNSNFGGIFNPAILPVRQYVSWVQYSSFVNGAFEVQWREEFLGGTLPTGWLTGNFASPFNLSIHAPQNVGFVNGIAVLSMTADNATGSPGVPPVDPAGTGGAGTGGTGTGGGGTGGAGTGGAGTGGGSTGGAATGGGSTGGAATGGAATGGARAASGGAGGSRGVATGGIGIGVGGAGTAGAAGATTAPASTGGSGAGGQSTTVTSTGGSGTSQASGSGGCSCQLGRDGNDPFGAVLFVFLLFSLRRRGSPVARPEQQHFAAGR